MRHKVRDVLLIACGLILVWLLPCFSLLDRLVEFPDENRGPLLNLLLVVPYLIGLTYPASLVVGLLLLGWGSASYARGKGYHWGLGLLAAATVVGLLVLAILPPR